jgi:hypothetical protein
LSRLGYKFWRELLSLDFFWNFSRDLFGKLSDKSSPQKLYPTWDVWGIIFEGKFYHWISFEIFSRDLFGKLRDRSSPQKLYPRRLNSTNKSLLKI